MQHQATPSCSIGEAQYSLDATSGWDVSKGLGSETLTSVELKDSVSLFYVSDAYATPKGEWHLHRIADRSGHLHPKGPIR